MDFFKRHFFVALSAVLGLIIIAYVGARGNLQLVFGVVVPYMAALIFVEGLIYRVIRWARSPVPFRIPTTGGQGRTLPWIKRDLGEKLDNPSDNLHLIGRMALEVLAFRSLFRNLRTELVKNPDNPEGARLIHWSYKWLWLGAIAFHYAFLVVILRHLRFFTEPVPHGSPLLDDVDGFCQFFTPAVYLSGVVLVVAVRYLLFRRITNPTLRYISLAADYFPLLLILGIGITGILMRYFFKMDIVGGETVGHRPGDLASQGAGRHRPPVLYPPLSGQRALCLLPLQQADARAGGVHEPLPEHGRQQPLGHCTSTPGTILSSSIAMTNMKISLGKP